MMLRIETPKTRGTADSTRLGHVRKGRQSIVTRLSAALQKLVRPIDLTLYAAGLAVAAAALALVLPAFYGLGDPWAIACMAAVGAVAERGSVRLTATTEVSISLVPTLFAAVLFGPVAAMIVGGASMLADIRGATDRPYLKWVTYTSSRAITGALTGIAAFEARELGGSVQGGLVVAAAVGALVAEPLDISFAAVTRVLRKNGSIHEALRALLPLALLAIPLYAPVVALLAVAYQEVSPWTLPLFMVPALAAQRLFALYQEQRRLTGDLVAVNDRLESANLSFATALVATVEARDRYTAGHSAAVAIYARDIAVRMGLSEEVQQLAHVSGLVHDVGKIGLPPGLLEKPGSLTLEERRQMERHSEIGERILAKVDDYAEIAAIVRHHHERWDGEGYPDKLRGEDIPILSRIIAVADAYNAMTSDRPYRDAMPSRVARLRLAQAADSQFDTAIVAAFEAVLAGASEDYRMATRDDFRLDPQSSPSEATAVAV
jgi:HD-GYP domain-containing protein (c-di-GMP phosphodiesterase class II)